MWRCLTSSSFWEHAACVCTLTKSQCITWLSSWQKASMQSFEGYVNGLWKASSVFWIWPTCPCNRPRTFKKSNDVNLNLHKLPRNKFQMDGVLAPVDRTSSASLWSVALRALCEHHISAKLKRWHGNVLVLKGSFARYWAKWTVVARANGEHWLSISASTQLLFRSATLENGKAHWCTRNSLRRTHIWN